MGTINKNISISSFVFSSKDNDVLIKGTEHQGLLSFDSEFVISQSQLNALINQLQKNNEDFQIENHLNSERVDYDEELYFADFNQLADKNVHLSFTNYSPNYKQIRA